MQLVQPSINARGKTSQLLPFLDIPAGGKRTLPAFGAYLYVVECSAPFLWRMDQTPYVPGDQGSRLRCVEGASFETVEVVNTNLVAISVKLFCGFAEYDQARFAIIEPPTNIRGQTGSLAGTTALDLTPVLQPGEVRRKAITISNGSAASRLHLRDAANVVTQFIFPESSIIVPISAGCNLYNPTGGAIDYAIGHIHWLTAT